MSLAYSRSLFWKLFIPVSLVLVLSGVVASVLLPAFVQHNAEQEAVDSAQATVRQFGILRKYYTDNVTSKVLSQGILKVGAEHHDDPRMVPLPATMIHDLSLLMEDSGTALKLYSPYPFPNRRERVNDQFGKDAWSYLQANPDGKFFRTETINGKTVVRVAMADRMSSPACVACHNSLASSPRKDWKLGDVRGVLEVNSSRELDSGARIVMPVLMGLGVMLLMLAAMLRLFYQRSIAQPLDAARAAARALTASSAEQVKVVEAIADGNLERELQPTPIPQIDMRNVVRDEIGELLGSVSTMGRVQHSLDAAFGKMSASLRASRVNEQASDWLKSSQNALDVLMRGEQELAPLAERILAFLVERLGAHVGTCYVLDDASGVLKLEAAHAVAPGSTLAASVLPGEGLLGRAVVARKTMAVDDAPAGYLALGSSLGAADAVHLLVVPLTHGDSLVGAIEIGAFRPFDAQALEFIEQAREGIAIGFEVKMSRLRTRSLLVETEQQAEELRVQQEELQQSNEELEERAELLERQREQIRIKNLEVEEASRNIWRKAEELQRVSAYKSEFMANMSHELRTPLNSMLILSGMLKEDKARNLSPKQVEYATTIHNAGKDLLNLINDILDLSKVEAGQVDFHYEATIVSEVCDALDGLFHASAEQKGLQWRVSVAPDVPQVLHTDVQRIQQILKNLLSNAIKFTERGTVGLHVYLPLAEENPLPGPAFACAVNDTGIGVAADKQALIFEAFKQADGGISRSYGGTGLGLSISLQLARKMDGELRIRSVEGEGSTFTLYLPLGAATMPAPKPKAVETSTVPQLPDDRARLAPGGKSILIVEDDLAFARILVDFVRARGYAALVAHDGDSGCALAREYMPSAVLLDVMLPRTDGWEAMHRLKHDPRTRDIPVHFISCLEAWQRAMDMGAVGFVTKPVNADQLGGVFDTIEQALSKAVKRLLIVEDSPDAAKSLAALMSERGALVTLASTGAQALALLHEEHFDCMVLDLGLPDMPGYDVLAHIQCTESLRSMPVIIHSGKDLERDELKELNRYAESIIVKGPMSPERLLNEVTLFLHMVEAKRAPELTAPVRDDVSLGGRKVLIADDDMRNIFSLTSLLTEWGMVVVEAENGVEALARLAEHPDVSVVLMDIMMPQMDGYAAMRAIRTGALAPQVPVIAMTAKAMQGDQQKCLDAGASDYLAKPLDSEKLLSMLRVWCS